MKFLSPGRRVIKHILINNLTFLTASTHGWAKDFVLSLQSASKYQRNCLDQRECEDCLCGGETPVCDIDLGCNRLSQDLSLYSSVLQVSSANTVAVLSDFPKQLGSAVQNSCFRHPCGTNCGFHVWLWCNASRPISLHAVIFVLSLVNPARRRRPRGHVLCKIQMASRGGPPTAWACFFTKPLVGFHIICEGKCADCFSQKLGVCGCK